MRKNNSQPRRLANRNLAKRVSASHSLTKLIAASFLLCTVNASVHAERFFVNTQSPAGDIGRSQLQRRPELAGVWQPVLMRAPDGATIWFAEGAGFSAGQESVQLVSLQVGSTYRLKISNIPQNYGDVYPTVEIIDRLHAPPGKETRYPVPIEITAEELKLALSGKFVTRVIYVEDPNNAIPARELEEQRYFEALPDEDAYEVATRIGRPIAILRMGSVVPGTQGGMAGFLFDSPPLQRHAVWPKQPKYERSELEPIDLPSPLEKLTPLPDAPKPPDATDELPSVPENLPAKKEMEEEPGDDFTAEPDLFEEASPADEVGSEDGPDDLFGDPDGSEETGLDDEDPFADFE